MIIDELGVIGDDDYIQETFGCKSIRQWRSKCNALIKQRTVDERPQKACLNIFS